MGTESEYERYEEPYSYEVRDRRVRGARGLQAVDGLTTSAVFDDAAERYVAGDIDARRCSSATRSCGPTTATSHSGSSQIRRSCASS